MNTDLDKYKQDLLALKAKALRVDVENVSAWQDIMGEAVDLIGLGPVADLVEAGYYTVLRYKQKKTAAMMATRRAMMKELVAFIDAGNVEPRTAEDIAYESELATSPPRGNPFRGMS